MRSRFVGSASGLLDATECLELLPREEIGVALDDGRLLGDALLANANSPAFFRALVDVRAQARFVGVRLANHLDVDAHASSPIRAPGLQRR